MCDPVVTPLFIDAIGTEIGMGVLGGEVLGGGLLGGELLGGELLAGEAAAGLAGAGSAAAGSVGAELAGAGLAGDALAGAGLSSYFSAMPEIGGTLQSLAFPSAAAPLASLAPAAEMSMSLPGWIPVDGVTGALTEAGLSPLAQPGSMWENISTPFKTASNMFEQAANSPIAKTLGNAKKAYDIYGALTQDNSTPPPVRVGGLQQQAPQQGRGGLTQAFGNRNFDAYR